MSFIFRVLSIGGMFMKYSEDVKEICLSPLQAMLNGLDEVLDMFANNNISLGKSR